MANLLLIEAERYVDGDIRDCIYMGSYQEDGWIYFNDDTWWRARPDKSIVQLFYISKQIWVNTNGLVLKKFTELSTSKIQNLLNGSGSTAPNADVETAVQWAIEKVTNNYITYDTAPRQTAVGDFNALQYDCSSFIITAFLYAGFPVTGATYTGNMRAYFEPAGFTWIPGTTWEASDLIRGDILLQETYHTQMYIGNGQDVNCGMTPGSVVTHWNYYTNDYAPYYGGWDGILRYTA